MCGINGYIDKTMTNSSGKNLLDRMNASLNHRGPDGSGIFIDGETGLGHTRLSIIDLSSSASQPMQSKKFKNILSFNGEIYNFLEVKDSLLKKFKCEFFSQSDTEVLLNALSNLGISYTLNLIEGMFAFAFIDLKRKKLFLARDRFGEKPLYYLFHENKLYFSSELSPLSTNFKNMLSMNFKNLDFYLKKSYFPVSESIYNEIKKVKPGSYIEFDYSQDEIKYKEVQHWDYLSLVENSINVQKDTNFENHKQNLKKLLEKKINQAMISDVPLGAFLSGGYDSTCMVSIMQSISKQKIKTFSIGFEDQNYNEAPFANSIAQYLGTDHEELYISQSKLISLIPELPKLYSEPFADSSQIPTVLLSRLTRSKVTVSISGDGGDEIFGGYNRYFLGETVKDYFKFLPVELRIAIKKTGIIPFSRNLFKPFLGNKVTNFENKINKLNRIFSASNDSELFYLLANFENNFSKISYSNPELSIWNKDCSYSRKAMTEDAIDYLPGDILNKVDIAGMSCSLETRIPFLNHKIAEYVLTIPHEYLVKDGIGKRILKEVVHDYVPKELMDRPKRGFEVPLNSYIKNELREYSESMIEFGKSRCNDFLDFDEIDLAWNDHLNDNSNQSSLLWNLISFFAWHERYMG